MSNSREARGEAARTGIEFLDRELDLCQTFLDTAEIEAHDIRNKTLAEQNARQAYQTVLAWIGRVRSGPEYERLSAKLEHLRDRLEGS